ncbi:leucine--tRNA ligase [Patescibacteria group bacterium]|nr:leucine--tRNA ligase [Patescibacteria group bacterium]
MASYNPKKIESKWQKVWAKDDFAVWHADDKLKDPKTYVLDMFPYPSGEGLHVGHVEGYTASDIVTRYYRMRGKHTLHPMGWDAFGLPAENYAIKKKVHPRQVVEKNIKNFTKQLRSLGFSYDWQREINTTDPEYYRWTQWIFLQLYKQGLAYEAEVPVNWCPSDKTVLANEEVIDDRCERCGNLVERKNLRQWILKITAYADRLLEDLELLDWPQKVKEMQRNWIGKSEGAEIEFPVVDSNLKVRVFTTRADTLPGVTYIVLAPEHELISLLNARIVNKSAVLDYLEKAKNRSDRERAADAKEKTGVEIKGIAVVNPFTKKEVPIWVSDYVLGNYGTGAVMAVPAHDERDFAHAKTFGLPIVEVVSPDGKEHPEMAEAFTGDGVMIHAGEYDGLPNHIAKDRIVEHVGGKKKTNYKLRDWVFSRQRYWGEPIPMIKCGDCGTVPVSESDLPIMLPRVKNYEPTGAAESPLAGIKKWVNVPCPQCGQPAKRETNTMPQWAGSCWYYLRYLDPKNPEALAEKPKEKYWMPVDIYIGGVEHAVLHLLYARFWHKVLFDIGAVSTKEPFQKLVNQGIILGSDGQKMSKSRGNVINPDELIAKFGADSLRLYEMFMGPLEDMKPWQPDGIIGVNRFLHRVHALVTATVAAHKKKNAPNGTLSDSADKLVHKTIKKVTADIEHFRFNTAISALMILMNELEREAGPLPLAVPEALVKVLFPFAPHLSQELWQKLGHEGLLDHDAWPTFDEAKTVDNEVELLIQINGKLRDKVRVPAGITQPDAEKIALESERVKEHLGKKKPLKIIFVPGRLVNIVVGA